MPGSIEPNFGEMGMAAKGKTASLDAKVVDKLLDLLGTDNEFRRQFKKDPKSALQKVGFKAGTPEELAAVASCCQIARIAPKADVVRARTQLREMFLAGLGQHPIQLDANTTASLRTRK